MGTPELKAHACPRIAEHLCGAVAQAVLGRIASADVRQDVRVTSAGHNARFANELPKTGLPLVEREVTRSREQLRAKAGDVPNFSGVADSARNSPADHELARNPALRCVLQAENAGSTPRSVPYRGARNLSPFTSRSRLPSGTLACLSSCTKRRESHMS
jgi:hypothetical protein